MPAPPDTKGLKDLAIIDGPDVDALLPYLEVVDALEAAIGIRRRWSAATVSGRNGSDESFLACRRGARAASSA